MKICFLGLENLPVLAPEYRQHTIGGESVQQTLLASALAHRGHDVSMVAADYGQADGAEWDSIRVFKAFRPDAGLPALRFIHPRWTGTWAALARADADLYYTSCAGMQVGLLALFCRRQGKRFVFRAASDGDCDPSRLLVRFARDRWLYAYGLRRAGAILVQSATQAHALRKNYRLAGRVARMLVEPPPPATHRDIDLLWVSNIRHLKRPDRMLDLAARMPNRSIHMAGGALPGEEGLFREVMAAAARLPNVTFHGRLSYWDTRKLFSRARVFVNTSDIEGFPNTYLQSWASGVPVVALIDPDQVIRKEELGAAPPSPAALPKAVSLLLNNAEAWWAASRRCRSFMTRNYDPDKILAIYLESFHQALCVRTEPRPLLAGKRAGHA